MAEFKCKRCGWCCENIIINVSHSDIIGWYQKKRWDILKEVAWINNYPRLNTGGFYITKTTLNPKRVCPFFKKENGIVSCGIHNVKPVACRDAPMGYKKFDGCKGFESPDKKVMKQIQRKHDVDFKKAFDERMLLMNVLIETRQVIQNG